MPKENGKKKGRYQVKLERGLVPHIYDKSSKRFLSGATKWPKNERIDRNILANRQTKYHCFI